jgi:hypothetical protein
MRILLFLSSIIISTTCIAQEVVTLQTDSGEMKITYFQREAGKKPVISTYYLWTKANKHRGVAVALNRSGKQLFRAEVGVVHGVQHVDFRYYANGAVERIHHTAQPDGGIQRHDVTRFYSEAGDFIRQEDNSTDNMGNLRLMVIPGVDELYEDVVVSPKDPLQELEVPTNDAVFTNTTARNVKVSVIDKQNNHCQLILELAPGETKQGRISTQTNHDYYRINVSGVKSKRKFKAIFSESKIIENNRTAFCWNIK